MPTITLEAIEAKQTELSQLIAKFKEQPKAIHFHYAAIDIELQPGEHYAGPVLNESGHVLHHLVLMAAKPTDKLNWQAALDWAQRVGGELPTRQELSLIFANCKPHLEAEWHWSCETHEDDASYAWHCGFFNGYIDTDRKSYEGSAVAVRRV